MPITEKQLKQRRDHIGGSDVAALLGVDPWRNAYDVFLEKKGRLQDAEPNPDMEIGTLFEDGVLAYAEKNLGKIIRNQYRSNPDIHLGCNLDAILVCEQEPVEAKTAGMRSMLSPQWGADGTDEVPDHVIVQCHAQMLVLNGSACKQAHVSAFLGGRGFVLYRIPRNDRLINLIAETVKHFWEYNVMQDIPPALMTPHLDVIKRARREPNKIAVLPSEMVQDYLEKMEIRKAAEKAEDDAKAAILATMGDAELGDAGFGVMTYYEQKRTTIDGKAILADHPEIPRGDYIKESTYRVMRWKERKD